MNKNKTYPLYFTFGAFIIFTILFILPGIIGIGYSFTDWSTYNSTNLHFVGFSNFKTVFSSSEDYVKILGNTLEFTIVTTIAKNALGLLMAVLLTRKRIKFINFHRSIMFMPSILSYLMVGMIFTSILDPATGLLNTSLRSINLGVFSSPWLTSTKFAFASVMSVDIWKGVGYIMTILIAGILSISPTYYEAASIDGANGFHCFFKITLPLLMPTLATTTVINVIYGLKIFDIIYAMTNGGPGKATTEVLYTAVYKLFARGQYAVGTALSSVLFIFMAMIGYFLIKLMTGKEVEE